MSTNGFGKAAPKIQTGAISYTGAISTATPVMPSRQMHTMDVWKYAVVSLWVLLAAEPTGAVSSSSYDVNFACCGGCSSSKRADAYSNKLTNGAHVFIWDTKLKTDPSKTCLLTFPYDKALNEQEGDRRVRSGQLVGTSYPIDHDFDSLCCEQRGLCRAIEEDASGKCQCVKKWGFTGDHCQFSVYAVAAQNNTRLFPEVANPTETERLLPDLRSHLVNFDMASAISAFTADAPASEGTNLLSVFQIGSDGITYRQYAWSTCGFTVLGAAFLAVLFLLQLIWSFCCFKCGCRKKDPRKQPKIYSKATKISWAVPMCVLLAVGTGASVLSFLTVHSKLVPGRHSISELLRGTLPDEITNIQAEFVRPLDQVLSAGSQQSSQKTTLSALQQMALTTMTPLTFLDAQSTETDELSKPVFALLDQLQNYSLLYPTVNSAAIDCANMNITPNAVSRMTIGSTSGCFRCKTCSQLSDMLSEAKDRWRRNAYKNQLDLRESRQQLIEFGGTRATLTSAIAAFRLRINTSSSVFVSHVGDVARQYDQLSTEAQQLTMFSLFTLMGLSGFTLVLSFVAVSIGLTTNKRPMARTTCFVGEVACLLVLVLVGVLYSVAMMAYDGIETLQLLNSNVPLFVGDPIAAQDVESWLVDRNFVEHTAMNVTLAFADTLRVPPHPTPTDDNPSRVNITDMYDFPVLFELETQLRQTESARVALFGWDQSFGDTQYAWLLAWAFANSTVVSPYNQTVHQTLLNSTTAQLLDPDNDTKLVTDDDFTYIRSVFNESWRGVSDRGVAQNDMITSQWLFVARLEMQKRKLDQYVVTIADIIASPKPLLQDLVAKTSQLEAAEFALKADVEFFTSTLRNAKLRDCSFDGNCTWFRETVNELLGELQNLLTHAEFAAICCAGSFVALLLGVICSGCFANRLRRNIVKVYSAN